MTSGSSKDNIPLTRPAAKERPLWLRVTIRLSIFFLIMLVVWIWLRSIFTEKIPDVPYGSVLVLNPYGEIVEYNRNRLPLPFLGTQKETLLDVVFSLKKAAADERIKGVILDLGDASFGWAQAEDIREAIIEYRKSGKKIYAFGESYSNREYFVATACDAVYLIPQGLLHLTGLSVTLTHIKGLLDLIGVKAEFIQIREYKTAPNRYIKEEATAYEIEQYNALLDTIFSQLTEAIATERKIEKKKVLSLIDEGPFTGKDALENKLVDGLLHFDGVLSLFTKVKDDPLPGTISHQLYSRVPADEVGINMGPRIGIVYATGTMISGRDAIDYTGAELMGSDTLSEQLRAARMDRSIRAVVVRIDSPGGYGIASEVMLWEIVLTRKDKPVVVSMGDVAASGGYYIACQANRILAQSTTITGSIGIYMGKFDVSGLYKKLGIKRKVLKRGEHADLLTETRSATEEEYKKGYDLIKDFYDGFLDRVAEGRKSKPEQIDKIAGGRVWSGKDALERGLVDEIGGMMKAVEAAKILANIPPESDVQIVLFPKRKNLMDLLFGGAGDETVNTERLVTQSFDIPENFLSLLSLVLNSVHSEGYHLMALLPISVEIN